MLLFGISPDLTRYFGEGNLSNYTNNDAQEILRELYSITDEKTLKEKYERLQNLYEDDRPYIGLYFSRRSAVYGKELSAVVRKQLV